MKMGNNLKNDIVKAEKRQLYRIDYEEYFTDYRYNLITPMAEEHIKQYGEGSGGELQDTSKPAKMSSVRSSSAMTFNLLGNHQVEVKPDQKYFTNGEYLIEYEKKLRTLHNNPNPANLDAYLCSVAEKNGKKEAIFCEMKMTEWIFNKPGNLKDAYLHGENYFNYETDKKNIDKFIELAKSLIKDEQQSTQSVVEHAPIFEQYDACQMFKHLLAIYNAVSGNAKVNPMMKDAFYKVSLLNVVCEPPYVLVSKAEQEDYKKQLDREHEEAAKFKELVQKAGIPVIFENDLHVDFQLEYLSVKEFVDCLVKEEKQIEYLKRYTFDKYPN